MTAIRFPEFLESLEQTKYPFVETATLSNGKVSFFEGTFLDAHIYAIEGTGRYYLAQVVVASDSFKIIIGDQTDPARLSGIINTPVTDEVVQLTDKYGRPGGCLVSSADRLAALAAWGLGTHTFERSQTEFCITCQITMPDPGVTGLLLPSGEILSGNVWLVGDSGVVLSTEQIEDSDGKTYSNIIVNCVGDPLYLQKLCKPEDLFTPVNPIRTIRVVNGAYTYDCDVINNDGRFNLQMNDSLAADTALRIRTTPEGIVINVEGSTPAG